jgi:hypothetical protein
VGVNTVLPAAAPGPQPRRRGQRAMQARRPRRALALFPWLLNFWPLLLLVSQKALVLPALVLVGPLDARYRRDLLWALLLLANGALILLVAPANEFASVHFIGYALFVMAMPLINAALREDATRVLHGLAWLSAFNALLAWFFYFAAVDLAAFRGLNRIVGEDDATHRVYFESSSLLAVFTLTAFGRRWLRLLALAVVLGYAFFLARSVFVVALMLLNVALPWILRGRFLQRLGWLSLLALALIAGPLLVAALRPDVALSLGIKLLQFEVIAADTVPRWLGQGWGYVIDEIINSPEQPYQVEMQLPMLVNQVGWIGVAMHAVCSWALLRAVSGSALVTTLRWGTYLAIGFNNPWLFIPSWYLTCCLLFRRMEART